MTERDYFSDFSGSSSGQQQPTERDYFSDFNGVMQTASASKANPTQQEEGWGEWAAGLPLKAYKAAVGTHDPAYKDVKAFDQMPAAADAGYKKRATVGILGNADDKAYGDIIERSLGPKMIRRFKDANGYDLIEHMGPDGKPATAYVNKPGLDMEDVGRGVVGALPYVVGGAWMGPVKGLAGVTAQGVVAGGTSLAGDALAMSAGGKDVPDIGKAGITAAAGSAGAAVAPAVGALWRRFVTVPGLVDSTGKLTAKGQAAAKAAGVDDVASIEGEIAKSFAKDYAKTGDAAAAALKAESGAYGVETTLGQRTKDPMQILREKGYRMGNYGDDTKRLITDLDQRQGAQIERMVRGNTGFPYAAPKVEPGMLERLAPNKPYVSTAPDMLGEEIKSGVNAARGTAKAGERAAWSEVPDLVPRQEAFSDLAPMITDRLGGRRLSTSTPKAMEMDAALADYASGNVVASGTKLVNQSPIQTVDDMRRHLKDTLFSVERDNAADKAAAQAIYDGYNAWVQSSAKKALLNGEADKAANLVKAVDLTKEMHSIFKPTGTNFKPNAATRIMETVMTDATPERIVSALFGSAKSSVKDGSVQALVSIKRGLDRYTPSTAAETWNAIRVAHWAKLIEGSDGKLLSPGVIAKNIQTSTRSQSSLLGVLYTQKERMEMMRISRVLNGVAWKDPNPSGTATAAQGLIKEMFGSLMRALPLPNAAKIGLEFSGVPNRLRNAAGRVGASNAVGQALPTMTDPVVSGYAGAGANSFYNNR